MWPNFSESKSWVKYHGRSPKVQSLDLQNFFLHMYFHIANSSYALYKDINTILSLLRRRLLCFPFNSRTHTHMYYSVELC